MTPTSSTLSRTAGIAAMAAGVIFIIIQPMHPSEDLAAVTTTAWTVTSFMTMTFAVLGLIGISGIYLRRIAQTRLLGLIGFVLFASFFLLTVAFTFVEVFVLPPLVEVAPQFVDSFNGISTGNAGPLELPALAAVWTVLFFLYFVGSILLGSALLRSRAFPRWAAASLVVAALATLTVPLLPHALERYAAVPMGLALVALGYLHWAEQGQVPAESVTPTAVPRSLDLAAQ